METANTDEKQINKKNTKYSELEDYQKGYMNLLMVFVFLMVWILVSKYVGRIVEVSGPSMNDYIYDGGLCVVKTGKFEINRYDVVLAKMNHKTVIKRVIGLPQDTIQIQDGVVYVNGLPCEEYDIFTEYAGVATKEIVLQEDEYFLLGDNRANSGDSRDYGAFDIKEIKGRVVKILWKGRG